MKKLILVFVLGLSMIAQAQVSDTGSLRAYINAHIVTNGNRSITAQQLNAILIGYLNVLPADSVSISQGTTNDSLHFWKHGVQSYTMLLRSPAAWNLNGNTANPNGANSLGTTDFSPIQFIVNNQYSGYLSSDGDKTLFGYQTGEPFSESQHLITAFGFQALQANQDGFQNAGFGYQVLQNNAFGSQNSAFGCQSSQTGGGSENSSFGYQTLVNSTGTANTAFGYGAGMQITTGSYNTIIGANITGLSPTLNNNIVIADGLGNQRIVVDSSGQMALGNYTPSASLHLPGGNTAPGTAPLKFTSGATLSNPENGAVEYDGLDYYGTVGANRYKFAKALTGAFVLSYPTVAAQTSKDTTISFPGAVVGDPIALGPSVTLMLYPGCSYSAWVSNSNVITVRLNNYSTSPLSSITGNLEVILFKYDLVGDR